MITKKELDRYLKLEKASNAEKVTPLYDEYIRLKVALSNAKNAMRIAKSNMESSKKALNRIDPEKRPVDIDSLQDGPWKDYCIFRAEKMEEIKAIHKKMDRDFIGIRNLTKESLKRSRAKDMPGAKEGLDRAKNNMKQYSGHLKKVSSILGEINIKRQSAEVKDKEYIRLREGLLQDNATFSETFNEVNVCEARLEQFEYKYRVAMESFTQ